MKHPPSLSTGDPSYFVVASTSGKRQSDIADDGKGLGWRRRLRHSLTLPPPVTRAVPPHAPRLWTAAAQCRGLGDREPEAFVEGQVPLVARFEEARDVVPIGTRQAILYEGRARALPWSSGSTPTIIKCQCGSGTCLAWIFPMMSLATANLARGAEADAERHAEEAAQHHPADGGIAARRQPKGRGLAAVQLRDASKAKAVGQWNAVQHVQRIRAVLRVRKYPREHRVVVKGTRQRGGGGVEQVPTQWFDAVHLELSIWVWLGLSTASTYLAHQISSATCARQAGQSATPFMASANPP